MYSAARTGGSLTPCLVLQSFSRGLFQLEPQSPITLEPSSGLATSCGGSKGNTKGRALAVKYTLLNKALILASGLT